MPSAIGTSIVSKVIAPSKSVDFVGAPASNRQQTLTGRAGMVKIEKPADDRAALGDRPLGIFDRWAGLTGDDAMRIVHIVIDEIVTHPRSAPRGAVSSRGALLVGVY